MVTKIERFPGNPTSCIFVVIVLGLSSRTLSVHSPCVARILQLPCHCPFWDDGMPQCHVEILHYQSFWKWSALCLPTCYSEQCQEYPPLHNIFFWNTGRLPSTVFPYQPIISITIIGLLHNTLFRFKLTTFLIQLAYLIINFVVCRFYIALKWEQNSNELLFVQFV